MNTSFFINNDFNRRLKRVSQNLLLMTTPLSSTPARLFSSRSKNGGDGVDGILALYPTRIVFTPSTPGTNLGTRPHISADPSVGPRDTLWRSFLSVRNGAASVAVNLYIGVTRAISRRDPHSGPVRRRPVRPSNLQIEAIASHVAVWIRKHR
jgi:hypothetical protein